MTVRVLTDSTAYFAPGEAAARGVTIVPLYVIFGETTYKDGVELSIDEFFAKLVSSKDLPKTSQPSAGDFHDAYRSLGQPGVQVAAIHLSSHLSGTHNTSRMAAEQMAGHPPVEVVDSLTTSVGQAFVVRAAAEAAARGAGLSDVTSVAREVAAKVHTYLAIDTLQYLQRGGRLGRAQAFFGSALDVKPIIGLDDEGKIAQFAKVRTRRKALDTLLELAGSRGTPRRLAVVDATTPADAQSVKIRLERAFPNTPVEVGRAGPVIGVHAGPGMMGIQVEEV
ncbi:MAG: DegV family protein [Dehalococcoidia bacterium]